MVSLLKLAQVTEEGVRFLSPHDGSPMSVSPRSSINPVLNPPGSSPRNTPSPFKTPSAPIS